MGNKWKVIKELGYRFLPKSNAGILPPDELAEFMRAVGRGAVDIVDKAPGVPISHPNVRFRVRKRK